MTIKTDNKKRYIKIIRKITLYFTLVYFGFLIVLFFMQKSMIYYPGNQVFSNCNNFLDEEKKEYKNTKFYEKKGLNNNIIVFFHGNAGRACDRTFIKELLEKTNSTIIFVEYSGYDIPEYSSPNIDDILNNVENIGEYIKSKNYEKLFIMGRSLGTGPASYLASINEIDKLLLISPYSQLYKIGAEQYPFYPVKYIFSENYNSEFYLKDYKKEVLIIHGKNDITVPYKFGKELFEGLITNKKEFVSLENTNHHNIFDSDEVNEKIVNYFK